MADELRMTPYDVLLKNQQRIKTELVEEVVLRTDAAKKDLSDIEAELLLRKVRLIRVLTKEDNKEETEIGRFRDEKDCKLYREHKGLTEYDIPDTQTKVRYRTEDVPFIPA